MVASQISGANAANPAAVFVVAALEKLLATKEIKKLPKLRDSSTASLAALRALLDNAASDTQRAQSVLTPQVMRKMLEPLQMACASRAPALIAVALDCIAKLFSYNVLTDPTATTAAAAAAASAMYHPDDADASLHDFSAPTPASPKPGTSSAALPGSSSADSPSAASKPLIETAVELVCECNIGEHTDEKVHLQVVKALLAAVSSAAVPIHGSTLLKAIRTTWNIFLVSKSPQIQMVASGSLTQMMNTVYGRAVVSTVTVVGSGSLHHRPGSLMSNSSPPSQIASEAVSPAVTARDIATAATTATLSSTGEAEGASAAGAAPSVNGADDDAASTTTTAATPAGAATSNLTRRDSVSFAADSATPTVAELNARDAFMAFRALCKLSTKTTESPGASVSAAAAAAAASADVRSTAIQSRVLALQLILLAIKSYSSLFTRVCYVPASAAHLQAAAAAVTAPASTAPGYVATTFLDASRMHLGLAVGRALASPIPPVYRAALDTFVACVLQLRHSLKREIEVFLGDVVLNIMEMRTSTPAQKVAILNALTEIMRKPQVLVEIYINYDCNPEALDNIFERMLTISAKLVSAPVLPTVEPVVAGDATSPADVHRAALEALDVGLKALADWVATCRRATSPDGQQQQPAAATPVTQMTHLPSSPASSQLNGHTGGANITPSSASAHTPDTGVPADDTTATGSSSVAASDADGLEDDPEALSSRKMQKMLLNEVIQLFNKKPKKGIQLLIDRGVIARKPAEIAHWLLNTEGLDKRELGDYLGEGDQENIIIMHAFVDALEFRGLSFVEALRNYLQTFRLPGESQKIDRFMLKFAERYFTSNKDHADNVFANPETAYVLAYSVIMLNTDLYNPQVKIRMTKDGFVRNNRGINDNGDLPPEYLHSIYDAIAAQEIKLKDDPLAAGAAKAALAAANSTMAGTGAVARKARREAFALALEEIANKIEVAFDAGTRRPTRRYAAWIIARHADHVRNMFEMTWMANLASLSTLLQKSEDPAEITRVFDAFRSCIIVSCAFDLDLERNAFITTLSNFTLLNNATEMKEKNLGAIRTLLDLAAVQGNAFKKSWLDVLRCISQLEQFHVIANDGAGNPVAAPQNTLLQQESTSQTIVVAIDKIFSGSVRLTGPAITDFVDALCTVSWDEVPRTYSLSKLVEISYYNMQRIRVEWVAIWAILGQHFNRIGSHANEQVAYFAVDSMRQLSMKFLEKDELSNFKFQREFLRPFEHVVAHQTSTNVREMAVRCIQQIIQARAPVLRSGWKAILAMFAVIARQETSESLFTFSYDVVKAIMSQHLTAVRECGSFMDAMATLIEYCKAKLSQKVSLQAVEAIHRGIKVLAESSAVVGSSPVSVGAADATNTIGGTKPDNESDWFAALHALYTAVVDCELEVRTRALQYLFQSLRDHGARFSPAFWQRVATEILFELFAPVTRPGAVPRGEEMSVWLSTTLIQALRMFVDLFGAFYDQLVHKLGDVLVLLKACILQENDTLARLGTSCLQQLMESNSQHLHDDDWDQVCDTWKELFTSTTAYALKDPETVTGAPHEQQLKFQQIIVKCVLQLLLIQTILEVTSVDAVYNRLQARHLLSLVESLEASYAFAREFNADLDLRTTLWKSGFTKQLPNLLKQETSAVTCLLHILFHMYGDQSLDRRAVLSKVEDRLIPLAVSILETYRDMDAESRKRNAQAWRPVLLTILNGLVLFDDDAFKRHIKRFYRLSIDLLMYEVSEEIRTSLHAVLIRNEQFIIQFK